MKVYWGTETNDSNIIYECKIINDIFIFLQNQGADTSVH